MGRAGAAKVPVITAFVCRQWGAFMHDAKHGDLAATHSRFVRPKLPATSAASSSAPSAPRMIARSHHRGREGGPRHSAYTIVIGIIWPATDGFKQILLPYYKDLKLHLRAMDSVWLPTPRPSPRTRGKEGIGAPPVRLTCVCAQPDCVGALAAAQAAR